MKAYTLLKNFAENKICRGLQWLILVLLGYLFALPFSLPAIGILSYVLAIPVLLLLFYRATTNTGRLRRYYGEGVAFFWGYHFGGFYWFYVMYPMDYVGLSKGESILFLFAAMVLLPLMLAAFYGIVFLLTGAIARILPQKGKPVLLPFVTASLFTLICFWQTKTELVIPFVRLAVTQAKFPVLAQSASLFGSTWLDFILIAVNGLFAAVLLGLFSGEYSLRKKTLRSVLPAILAFGIFLSNLLLGTALYAMPEKAGETVTAAALQGNLSSSKPTALSTRYTTYATLTRQAAKDGASMVLWPETALVTDLSNDNEYQRKLSSLAKELGVTIALGAPDFIEGGGAYNCIYLFNPDGTLCQTQYRKQHLVPFGEYVPYKDAILTVFPFMGGVASSLPSFVPAEKTTVITNGSTVYGGMICFDSIYPDVARAGVRAGAEVLFLPTNDSWFFDSAATEMHLAHARLRAIESGCYVVRAGHTGISAVITPKGECKAEVAPLEQGYALADVTLLEGETFYAKTGDWFMILVGVYALFFPALALGKFICRKGKKQQNKNQWLSHSINKL